MGTLRIAAPTQRTLPALLELQAERQPSRPLVRDGARTLSVAGARELAAARAGSLAGAGIGPGDRVALLAENRLEVLELWLGCAWLGAVLVPINTALRGAQLAHVLANSGARLLVLEPDLLPALDGLEAPLPALERLWTLASAERGGRSLPTEPMPAPADAVAPHPAAPGDPAAILYTSGTTGPSKGVICPHAQWYWWAVTTGELLEVDESSVLYSCLPLFHTNALNTFCQALVAGATFVVGGRFSASAFWRRAAEAEATHTYLLGAMVSILARRPPSGEDRAHRVRVALAPATPAELHGPFRERFGVALLDGWGSTETNCVIGTKLDEIVPGSMGRVRPGYQARVVGEHDEEMPDGTPGELVVRGDEPFSFATGYFGLPERTVEAWRNLWFHTGDRVVRDPDGTYRFLDRIKDSIRRRGENISSYEVEQALVSHPDVAAAAAVAVPSELGEDEVLAVVVPRAGAELDPADLIRFCDGRLAYFAVPRYVEVAAELPLTASGKVEKYRLRDRGVTASTWDREAAGVQPGRR